MSTYEQPISVGNHGVGSISVDSSQVTGEGGPVRPHLVVPIKLKLNTRSKEENQLAIPQLTAALGTTDHGHPQQEVCEPVTLNLTKNMPVLSLFYDHPGFTHHLRFALTCSEVAALEAHRHLHPGQHELHLYLSVDPMVVGLRSSGEQPNDAPWGHKLGLSSFMSVFWTVQVQSLQLTISQQTWVEKVLPGLGYDQLRMVEVKLPPPLPEHGSAATEFDKAQRAWDQRRYDECVAACRGLVKIWTVTFHATAANPLGEVIGNKKRWLPDDPRRRFLTDTWNAVIVIVNASHHPENTPGVPVNFEAPESRLIFMMVASLSEYLNAAIL
jgi:hypothetical protein